MKEQDLKLKIAELKDTIVFLRKELELIKNKNKMENKETLEEAAENYNDKFQENAGSKPPYIKNKHIMNHFIEGANWQAERSYSEEEVYKLLCSMPNFFNMTIPQQIKTREKWFKNFKKK